MYTVNKRNRSITLNSLIVIMTTSDDNADDLIGLSWDSMSHLALLVFCHGLYQIDSSEFPSKQSV